MSGDNRPRNPGQRSGMLGNLRSGDYGFFERAGRIFGNVGRKVIRRQLCCGNYGEPGC